MAANDNLGDPRVRFQPVVGAVAPLARLANDATCATWLPTETGPSLPGAAAHSIPNHDDPRYRRAMLGAVLCRAGVPTSLVRNVAARGLVRTFTVRTNHPATGELVVRSGLLPFFIASKRQVFPLADGLEVKRGFFDASFEVLVTPDADVHILLA
jgi:hypothetical protein